MTLPACAVTTRVYRQDGTPDAGARAVATLNRFDIDDLEFGYVGPVEVEATANELGEIVLNLWPNARGSTESRYKVRVEGSERTLNVVATVPDVVGVELSSIAALPAFEGKPEGQLAIDAVIQRAAESQAALDLVLQRAGDVLTNLPTVALDGGLPTSTYGDTSFDAGHP